MKWDESRCECRDDWNESCYYCEMYEEELHEREREEELEKLIEKIVRKCLSELRKRSPEPSTLTRRLEH